MVVMADRREEEAAALATLRAGRFGDAVASAMPLLRSDPTRPWPWFILGVALAAKGDFVGLREAVNARQRAFGDAFVYFHELAVGLMEFGLHDAAAQLGDNARWGDLSITSDYVAGCVHLLRGDDDKAFDRFRSFKQAVADCGPARGFAADTLFNVAYRQGTLIEDHDYVAALDRPRLASRLDALPAPEWIGAPARAAPAGILLAACDAGYLKAFAARLVATTRVHAPDFTLHLHVVGPDDEAVALLSEFAGQGVAATVEAVNDRLDPSYYACARFLVARRLAGWYRSPLWPLDVDLELLAPLAPLAAAAEGSDLAFFRYSGFGPCSRYPAVLTRFASTETGVLALDTVAAFIGSKLDVRWPFSWMLDQAALGSTIRWCRRRAPQISLCCLQDAVGEYWTAFMRSCGGDDEKAGLRAGDVTPRV
ncbi:MAG: hypothetical protein AB1918_07375 [Pseudomonadota bacterium]